MVGLGAPDDAAVYKLDDERALIVTTDFFTPIVDDPYQYGAIAAANSLSDVYAMGGTPILALNIAALPPDLPLDISTAIMQGAADKAWEAKTVIAGGHTIQDKEPKVGLAVVGMAHPDKLMLKGGAKAGDVLVLTKPISNAVITTAFKNDKADMAHVENAAQWMLKLNRIASEVGVSVGVRAATDVTGFGLTGHGLEMANASKVTFRMDMGRIPLLDGVAKYAEMWTFPGGTSNNRLAYEASVRFEGDIPEQQQMLVFDPQTSGGLLMAVPADKLEAFGQGMAEQDTAWWQIGEVVPRDGDVSIVYHT
jgi:selenide,water dikinase